MKIVPTVTERGRYYHASVNHLSFNSQQIPEVKFTYDFEAITSVYTNKKSSSQLLVSICAIVGGWYALTIFLTKFIIK